MKKEKQVADEKSAEKKSKYSKPLRQKGGTYFYCGSIIGRKNVFVTKEYLDLMANAFKSTELKKDVKNLAYVVMPNYFYWIFKLSERQDDPVQIYAEVKKDVGGAILKNLKQEVGEGSFQMHELFKGNERVARSAPEKLLWTFEMFGKEFESSKRYRVWTPKTEIRLIDNDKILHDKLQVIKKAPISERWKMTEKSEDYPYLYVAEELENENQAKTKLSDFLPIINIESAEVSA